VAEALHDRFEVTVLTTCATDHLSWKNVLIPGWSVLNGVRVLRFQSVQERELEAFHEIYDQIFQTQLSAEREHEMLRRQGPYCPDLIDYLRTHGSEFDAFVIFTCIYYPSIRAIPLVGERAILVPTAHDEPSLYLHILDKLIPSVRTIFFNSEEERLLMQKRFALASGVGEVVGVGMREPRDESPDKGWSATAERLKDGQLLSFVGRVEKAKGCDELADYFLCYIRERQREDLHLLFLGHRSLPLPPHPQLLTPGRVSEQHKWAALRNSTVVMAPSPNESLAALEGWVAGKPLLANGRCRVLVGHCLRSDGGLWYSNYEEFQACLDLLLSDAALREKLGGQGREYVLGTHRWERVLARYESVLSSIARA
jgi:glycosyltransferase involved in cell wall biosynthesis